MNIFDFTREELTNYLKAKDFKKYNATQVFQWLYRKLEFNFEHMSNLNKNLISFLEDNFTTEFVTITKHLTDKDVDKFLIKLNDGEIVEAVLMRHDYGNSLCVSSQIGCNMGCNFCASGKLKKIRNLETHEMITTLLTIQQAIGERISHVVIMGIGEPFDNYDNVINFIKIINDDNGLAIGARHITVSTSGIIPGIKKFSELPLQVNLALSLHAADDDLRSKLMPINKKYSIKECLDAINEYTNITNRRATIEYIMLKGINDLPHHAEKLGKLLKGMKVYVNLIPYNDTDSNFTSSSMKNMKNFKEILKKYQINVTIRKEFGSKINAACGQLRAINKGDDKI